MAGNPGTSSFVQQLYDMLLREDMRDCLSWNENNPHFTFHRNAPDFQNRIASNFTTVQHFTALKMRLEKFGFKNQGDEWWHQDFLQGRPELLNRIVVPRVAASADNTSTPSFSQQEKAAAISLSKEVAGYEDPSDQWRELIRQLEEASSNVGSEAADADVPLLIHPSLNPQFQIKLPPWCGIPRLSYQLKVLKETTIVKEHPLEGKAFYLFGRKPHCDFKSEHSLTSRIHAVLLFTPDGESYIYDNSAHGTFINKEPVQKGVFTRISCGKWISCGDPTCSYLLSIPCGTEQSGESNFADVHVVKHPSLLPSINIPDWAGVPCHQYRLQVFEEGNMVKQHILSGQSSYIFGRLPTCEFQLFDEFASRCQAALLFRPTGEAYILDNSAVGTLINNERVPKGVSTKLNSGDRFSFRKINRSYLFQVLKPSEEDPSGFSGENPSSSTK